MFPFICLKNSARILTGLFHHGCPSILTPLLESSSSEISGTDCLKSPHLASLCATHQPFRKPFSVMGAAMMAIPAVVSTAADATAAVGVASVGGVVSIAGARKFRENTDEQGVVP